MEEPQRAEYVLYLRKSKGRAGTSRQRTVTTAHIERHGATIIREYVDTDRTAFQKVGGARPTREDFDAMLETLRAHPGLGVAAWHADRLLRNPGDTEMLINTCAAGGHLVETPSGGTYDLSTATGRKRLRNDATDAAYEVDHAIERITAAKLEAAAAGRWLGGRRPFGYEPDGKTIRLAEAQAIRDGSRAIIDGLSLREVTRAWNAAGLRPSGAPFGPLRRNPWAPGEVSRVLRRPRNAALMEHRGQIVDGVRAQWAPVVDESTWRAVRDILTDPGRRTTPGPERRYLLSGIACCGICGKPLIATITGGNGRHKRAVYRCRPAGESAQHVARDTARADSWVTDAILARIRMPDIEVGPQAPDTSLLRAELASARRELDELARHVAVIGVRQMAIASGVLNEKIAGLEAKLAAAERTSALGAFRGRDAAQVWEELTLHQRRAVVAELATVTVYPAPRGRPPGWRPGESYFIGESVRVEWRETH